jgi:hypothetical protein
MLKLWFSNIVGVDATFIYITLKDVPLGISPSPMLCVTSQVSARASGS